MRLTEAPPTPEAANGLPAFLAVGKRYLGHFRDAGLKPHHRVLDIGCGSGRMAVALGEFLSAAYEGFDVSESRIAWATEHITSQRPDFRFTQVNVKNGAYSREGEAASEFRFPYGDDSFDFAIASSLFTHLLHEDTERYVEEAARVLSPGGILFATFFLLDDVSLPLARSGEAEWLRHEYRDGAMVNDLDMPEMAIGYPEEWVLDVLRRRGLEPVEVLHGTWSGRDDGVDFQDSVVAKRAA